jgi:hypothetical protein
MMKEQDAQTFRVWSASKQRDEKSVENKNGVEELPRAKDFKLPKRLTKDQKELLEAFREATQALKEEEAKYGKKDYSIF